MKTVFFEYNLQLKYSFSISTHRRNYTPVAFIRLISDDNCGWGEASLPPYLKYTRAEVLNCWKKFNFEDYDISQLIDLEKNFIEQHAHCPPACAAVSMAVYDLLGKINQAPLWKILGTNPSEMPLNMLTIGIDKPDVIKRKIEEAGEFRIIKLKIGSKNDASIIRTVRKVTDKPIVADANQGYKNVETAIDMAHRLYDNGAIIFEQPLPKDDLRGNGMVSEKSPIPVIADESFQNLNDLEKIRNVFRGINVKLMKCGSISSALNIIQEAKKFNLLILMGSMNESSCANLAAAHLSPLCNWADLDGPFLINNNPFQDIKMKDGKIILDDKPGLGITFSDSKYFS